jgi:hypothetical protein
MAVFLSSHTNAGGGTAGLSAWSGAEMDPAV